MRTFKKIVPADRSYGRGMDNRYIPARYGIFEDGEQIGQISADSVGYMEPVYWDVTWDSKENMPYGRYGLHSFREAKEWARAKALPTPLIDVFNAR